MFKSLGISQQQYAIRTNYDKSYISRFLNGRRVATQEFIDRLLHEVEVHRRTSITVETRARLRQLRDSALQVYDPDLSRLESMRSEVHKHQREVRRLLLHQEALEALLERRQAEAEEYRRELGQAQSDWMAERIRSEAEVLTLRGEQMRHRDERQTLLDEIARLRTELRVTIEQKREAEQRCAALEERAVTLERGVAEQREREGVDDIGGPVDLVQGRLLAAEGNEVYRELAEFALGRSSADVVQLSRWLVSEGRAEHAEQLVADYCRQRPMRYCVDVILIAEEQEQSDSRETYGVLLAEQVIRIVSRSDFEGFIEFCEQYVRGYERLPDAYRLIQLDRVSRRWFGRYRTSPERLSRFFEVFDRFVAMGEQRAAVDMILQVALGGSGISPVFGRVIAESGREAENRIVVEAFLRSVARRGPQHLHLISRQIEKVDKFSNSIMADLMLAGLCEFFDAEDLARIMIISLDLTSGAVIADRIAAAVVAYGPAVEVRNSIARSGLAITTGDKESLKASHPPQIKRLLGLFPSE